MHQNAGFVTQLPAVMFCILAPESLLFCGALSPSMPHNSIFVAQLGRLHCTTYATLRVCVLKVSLGTSLCRCIVKNGHLDTVSLVLVCSVVHQQ